MWAYFLSEVAKLSWRVASIFRRVRKGHIYRVRGASMLGPRIFGEVLILVSLDVRVNLFGWV